MNLRFKRRDETGRSSVGAALCRDYRGVKPLLLIIWLSLSLTSFAQSDLFITVSAASEDAGGTFTTVSAPAAAGPEVKTVRRERVETPPVQPEKKITSQVAASVAVKKQADVKWEQELLRDPFWPVGFFPEGWQKKSVAKDGSDADESGWKAASGRIKISGTSKLGGKTAAIINGELKTAGDQIEVLSNGQTYQWQVVGIDANGQVQLKKMGIK